jgi:ParB-like chromosome segregation protein Spo0J
MKRKRTKNTSAKAVPVALEPIGPRAANRVREETWAIERVVPYERNARTHDQAQIDLIRGLLRQYGQVHRVLVDEEGVMIAGHGRREALAQEKFAEVKVLIAVGWSEAEKRKFRMADNQSGLRSGWDEKLLRGEVVDLGARRRARPARL